MDEKIKIVVDGSAFNVSSRRLQLLPDSYFCAALKPHWNHQNEGENELVIEGRSADLFEHIVDFIRFGCIPRSRNGDCLIDRSLLPLLRVEADYYSLVSMVTEIDELMGGDTVACNMIRNCVDFYNNVIVSSGSIVGYEAERHVFNKMFKALDDLFRDVPYALSGTLAHYEFEFEIELNGRNEQNKRKAACLKSYKSTELRDKDIMNEIIESSDIQCTFDPTMQNANHLIVTVMEPVNKYFFPTLNKTDRHLKFSHSCINVPGNTPTISVDDLNSYGTVVFVPSCSSFKGGNLTISQPSSDDDTPLTVQTDHNYDVKTRCTFVAYQSDCECVVEPVSEGMQVLLVFKIIHTLDPFYSYYYHRIYCLRFFYCNVINILSHGRHLSRRIETLVLSELNNMLNRWNVVGIVLQYNYVSEGFCEENLNGVESRLLQEFRRLNMCVSLVNVVRSLKDNSFRLFNGCDTRTENHKCGVSRIPFFGSYDMCYHTINTYRGGGHYHMMAAFIVSRGETDAV